MSTIRFKVILSIDEHQLEKFCDTGTEAVIEMIKQEFECLSQAGIILDSVEEIKEEADDAIQ